MVSPVRQLVSRSESNCEASERTLLVSSSRLDKSQSNTDRSAPNLKQSRQRSEGSPSLTAVSAWSLAADGSSSVYASARQAQDRGSPVGSQFPTPVMEPRPHTLAT